MKSKSNNLYFYLCIAFPLILLIFFVLCNRPINNFQFQIDGKPQLRSNLRLFDFIAKHESWVFVHLTTPFLVYVFWTQNVWWALLVIVVWEMFEVSCVLAASALGPGMGLGSGAENHLSKWWEESSGDAWLGDIQIGMIGIAIGYFMMTTYFPDILEHLREKRRRKRQWIMLIFGFMLTATCDLIALITLKLPNGQVLNGIGDTLPLGYVVYILLLIGGLNWFWSFDYKLFKCIPRNRLSLFHSNLILFFTIGWTSTVILLIPTYMALWIFVGLYVAYIAITSKKVHIDHEHNVRYTECDQIIYSLDDCKYLKCFRKDYKIGKSIYSDNKSSEKVNHHHKIKITFASIIIFIIILVACIKEYNWIYGTIEDKELRWDWDNIEINAKEIAETIHDKNKNFYWGSSSSAYQVEGHSYNNQWYLWEQLDGTIDNEDKAGVACDNFNKYKQDIQLMKNIGMKMHRFSIEWSKIQPTSQKGLYDKDILKHYHNEIDYLKSKGIEPMITLHHFTEPIWFSKLGGFELYDNIKYFNRFAYDMWNEFNGKVKYFATFNEPLIYGGAGWMDGVFPPGKKDPETCLFVLKHILISHTKLYRKIKSSLNGNDTMIGIVKNIHQFDPYTETNIIQRVLARIMNKVYTHSFMNYFLTGRYELNVPFMAKMNYTNPLGKNANDFMGMNYYSHFHVEGQFNIKKPFKLVVKPEYKHLQTGMDYTVYAEGFYRGLKYMSKFNKPIIVTENGMADKNDQSLRELYIKRYLYALAKAVDEGVHVIGYNFWSIIDNFEWNKGFSPRFGLYHVDYETQERTLKKGSVFYVNVINEFNKL